MELQTAFYIMSIVFMSVMLILIAVLVAAVLVIKAKVNKVHDTIEAKVNQAKALTSKFSIALNTIKFFVRMRKGKRT
jgi:hypothetical protein